MRRTLFIFTMIITMISCDKAPINGDLDGMWKMTLMQWSDGEEITPKRIFFCFEQNCIELCNKGDNPCNYIGLMIKESNTITVDKIKNSAGEIKDGERLKQFGISETPTKFNIEKMNSSKLIIKSNKCTLHFTKF